MNAWHENMKSFVSLLCAQLPADAAAHTYVVTARNWARGVADPRLDARDWWHNSTWWSRATSPGLGNEIGCVLLDVAYRADALDRAHSSNHNSALYALDAAICRALLDVARATATTWRAVLDRAAHLLSDGQARRIRRDLEALEASAAEAAAAVPAA